MSLQLVIVRLTAAVFALYGAAFIVAPEVSSHAVTGTIPATAPGLIDMRATYGGMSVAVGVLLFLLASRDTVKQGMLGVILLMLGMAGGRLYGIVVDGAAGGMMYLYLALEVSVAGIAIWVLARPGESSGS